MSENDTKKVQKCQKNFWNQKIRCSSKRVKFPKFSKSFRYQNGYSIRICWHFRTRFLTFLRMCLVCYILLHFCTVKNLEYFKNLFFFHFNVRPHKQNFNELCLSASDIYFCLNKNNQLLDTNPKYRWITWSECCWLILHSYIPCSHQGAEFF